jgi:hypothetical protein
LQVVVVVVRILDLAIAPVVAGQVGVVVVG